MDLIEAILNNDVASVKKLLAAGADPNICLDDARITPLHFAAQNNAVEVVPLLIEAGANLNAEIEPEGYTPLHIAQIYQHLEMIALLTFYANAKI